MAKDNNTPQILVLAGLASGAEDRGIHVICADTNVKKSLQDIDINVSSEHPKSGMIGIAGLLISLSPLHGVTTIGLVAETIGASTDTLAADRLSSWIEQGLDLPLDLDLDTTEKTAKKLLATMDVSEDINQILNGNEKQNDSNFYA